MSRNNQYSQRFWDKKAYRYEKRALNKNSPSYISCLEFMKEAVEANAQVIDLGCGTGIMGEVLMDKVSSYLGIDISSGMISLAKGKKIKDNDNKMTFRKGDMHNTSLNKHTADNVLLCHILEYTKTPDVLLLEAKRLTRPNGLVITSTNCYGTVRSAWGLLISIRVFLACTFKLIPYIRFYTFKKLRYKLENSGMVIIAEKKIKHMGKTRLFAVLKT